VRDFILPGHNLAREPELLFHPDRPQDSDVHPLRGLLQYGPYSRSLINAVLDPIKIATIYPFGYRETARAFLREFEQRHAPKERRSYLLEFPGFSRVFGLRITPAVDEAHVELPETLSAEVKTGKNPHLRLGDAIIGAMNRLHAMRTEFDIVMIFLPESWSPGFKGRTDDFDLHDYVKAVNASRGMPTQFIREQSALRYFCRASVMWRLGIALYCKAGGAMEARLPRARRRIHWHKLCTPSLDGSWRTPIRHLLQPGI
jgi:hypothetical protein